MSVSLYAIFHLNLGFSAIEEEQRRLVINKCYWPLLEIIRMEIPLGIEVTGHTLELINDIMPAWINEFKDLLKNNKCELLASGDSQIIGPLVPSIINDNNLSLGMETYKSLLDYSPNVAYLNEQVFSAGLIDLYIDAGYEALVLEFDNIFSHVNEWNNITLGQPAYVKSLTGRKIKVIWNHSIAFQKFQRYAHGEISLNSYYEYLSENIHETNLCFPLYGSDAEIFNYRPGRYKTEVIPKDCEWARIKRSFSGLSQNTKYKFCLPSDIATLPARNDPISATSAEHPVIVKKQPKYNATRWGLSGRNDLLINTNCYKLLEKLQQQPNASKEQWQSVCRLWSSDLRTHLTETRYRRLCSKRNLRALNFKTFQKKKSENDIVYDREERFILINKGNIKLKLNVYRGLAIESLAFSQQNFIPVMGKIPHGYFKNINFGADYYSNHLIVQNFESCRKETDLNLVSFDIYRDGDSDIIWSQQKLEIGTVSKWYEVKGNSVKTGVSFENKLRPFGSLRLGYITLLDSKSRAWFQTKLGGRDDEYHKIRKDIDQGAPVSSIVSSSGVLGATDGTISFGTRRKGIKISWQPSSCASLPMISSLKVSKGQILNRLWFSLVEADETLKKGGQLLDFSCKIEPIELVHR